MLVVLFVFILAEATTKKAPKQDESLALDLMSTAGKQNRCLIAIDLSMLTVEIT